MAHVHQDQHHHGEGGASGTDADLADLLDLDATVLSSYWADALAWVCGAAPEDGVVRVLDLGAGTGTGTIGLAEHFGAAEVIAVDLAADMLQRIGVKARERGFADRVRTVQADLDGGWPVAGPLDLTWASMSLHHLADPDRVLRDLFAATRDGGLVAVAEFSEQLRFLPDDLVTGRPGLEDRCLAALAEEHARSVPELGSDWPPRLEAAGFTLRGERSFGIELRSPLPAEAAQYARLWIRRLRSGLADRMADDDLRALDVLIGDGPESLEQRDDLHIRGTRTVTLARRPSP